MTAEATGWSPPEEFDEYRIVRPIGQGGMGQVFLAHDLLLDRPVAVKFIADLEPNGDLRERFLVEARASARLAHPNVVAVHRVGEINGRPYIVSEFVRGKSLAELEKPVPWERALELGLGLARGLAAAHRRGVLHRDIKPANAIIDENGEPKLLDFGLAKLMDAPPGHEAARTDAEIGAMPVADAPTPRHQAEPLGFAKTVAEPSLPRVVTTDPSARTLPPTHIIGAPPLRLSSDRAGTPREGVRAVSMGRSFTPPLTQLGMVMGTPYYMAPEIWRGEAATRRSDVYSLGALLYELCAGRPPHANVVARNVADVGKIVENLDAAPLGEAGNGIDARFATVVDRCLRRDPAARFRSGEALKDALEALSSPGASSSPAGNPYRGLHAFEAEHRSLFFGRLAEVRAVVERLRGDPFVLVAGDSGVGKSSLCRAGVLPALAEGALGEGRSWQTARLVPGRRPFAALGAALAPVLVAEEESLVSLLGAEPRQVAKELRRAVGNDRGLVIFVDQLEELVTLCDPAEGEAFGLLLGQLAIGVKGVRLLASVRSDFLTPLATVAGLGDEVSRAFYLLRPLSPENVREAVVGPARATGVSFESEELVDTLVSSTAKSTGSLPLLQFALAELWEARDQQRGMISASALARIGGVDGALARHADGVLSSLRVDQRLAARRLFLKLVTPEGTRARRTEEELVCGEAAMRPVLLALVRGRLLATHETDGAASYEVAHEALLSGWATLRGWIDQLADTRLERQRLQAAASEWRRISASHEALWGARHLSEAALVPVGDLDPVEVAFLSASRRAVRRARAVRLALLIGLPLLVASSYLAVRLRDRAALDRRVNAQLAEAKEALAHSRTANGKVEQLRADAFGRFDTRDRSSAEKIWAEALALAEEVDRNYTHATGALETALRLDSERRSARDLLGDVLFERARLAERDQHLAQEDELLLRASLYDEDGVRMHSWRAPAEVRLDTQPAGVAVTLFRDVADAHGPRRLEWVADLGTTPLSWVSEAAGSYRAVLSGLGRAVLTVPFLLSRGERLALQLDVPAAEEVPAGFAFVPAGRFLVGSSRDDNLRAAFLNTTPLHTATTGAYLIARHETTYAEWIAFLEALPPAERHQHTPAVAPGGFRGALELTWQSGRDWQLSLTPTTQRYVARAGERLEYGRRDRRRNADWLQLPVSGISAEDAEAYVGWLSRSGRLATARLCTELEWERAARGADDREYPGGDRLESDDANFDETYGKEPLALGPDEVGSHPASVSPFGVDDLCGNLWEWTTNSLSDGPYALRGGSYYHDRLSVRSTNRQPTEPTLRDPTLGLRVCATVKPSSPSAEPAH